ncbi:MAG TPA: S41 family peptidase [Anaerolineales bacterium]|nr:S41 family peptidase [Anaerolineales bacterium]
MSKLLKLAAGLLAGLILAGGIFSAGLAIGYAIPQLTQAGAVPQPPSVAPLLPPLLPNPTGVPRPTQAPSGDRDTLMQPFWEAWGIVHDQFVDLPLDDTSLVRGAIEGMINALGDEQSSYMDPDMYRQANIPLEGSYEGIGAWVDSESEFLTIIAPMPGSPAELVGLKSGDVVIAVDGEDMTGIDGSLVIRKVIGPAGTKVVLTVVRKGVAEPLEFEITRANISVPSAESRMIDGDIAYVRLYTFGQSSTDELRKALRELMAQDPKGLILDLRGNGGGFLSTAIEVASQFIPDGVIMTEHFGDGRIQTYEADRGGLATDVPLVVLIDGGSASASEIVAGAIQDRDRGKLVGETSFGKGSVQNWVPLQSDGGAVRVTIARWYTPNGRLIDKTGLEPDVEVQRTDDDFLNNRDPQLDRAVEILHSS